MHSFYPKLVKVIALSNLTSMTGYIKYVYSLDVNIVRCIHIHISLVAAPILAPIKNSSYLAACPYGRTQHHQLQNCVCLPQHKLWNRSPGEGGLSAPAELPVWKEHHQHRQEHGPTHSCNKFLIQLVYLVS